jgi:hypothetical protein
MLSAFITSFVFAAVLSAYIFLGRGLTRQGNEEMLESRSRQTLFYVTQDVSSATAIDPLWMGSPSGGNSILKLYYPDSSDEVIYTYNSAAGTLTRTFSGTAQAAAAPGPAILFTGLPSAANPGNIGLSSMAFSFYDFTGTPTTAAPAAKQVNLTFTALAGIGASGAQSHINVVSPRILMKSKPFLGTTPNGLP